MRTLRRIIVGHDLQPGGFLAVRSAAALAKRCDAHVKLVHVVEPYPLYQRLAHPLTSTYSMAELVQRAGEALRKLTDEQSDMGRRWVRSRRWRSSHQKRSNQSGKPFLPISRLLRM